MRDFDTTSANMSVWPGSSRNGWKTRKHFELAAPVRLNLVCFRHRQGDEATLGVLERVNASGKMYLTHTRLKGRTVLRMCIGQTRTRERHVDAAWQLLQAAAEEVF